MEKFRCTWGRSITVITVISLIIMAFASISTLIVGQYNIFALVAGLFIVVFGTTYAFCPKQLTIDQGNLIVKRVYGEVIIKLNEITTIERRRDRMFGDIRLFGSGGVFGYIGIFRNVSVGKYTAYTTDPKNKFWVVTEKKSYLLSCENCDRLIEIIKNKG